LVLVKKNAKKGCRSLHIGLLMGEMNPFTRHNYVLNL